LIYAHAAVGTDSADNALPAEVAHVLSLRTAYRGRRYRGRLYLPAMTTGTTDVNGNLTGAKITSILAQWNAMVAELAPKQWSIVVASYGKSVHSNGTITTWTPFATDITSATMDSKPDVQRRRK